MTLISHTTICTIHGLKRTIETDQRVFRWFLYLIDQPKAKAELAAEYPPIQLRQLIYEALNVILLGIVVTTMITKHYSLLFLGAAVFCLSVFIEFSLRKRVAAIGLQLIDRSFDKNSVGKNTLFQIGNHLANKYGASPLALSLSAINHIFRAIITIFVLIAIFIYPQNLPASALLALALYFLFQSIHFSPLYQQFK